MKTLKQLIDYYKSNKNLNKYRNITTVFKS